MDDRRKLRVKTQSRSALGMLRRAALEAEALADQTLANDLWRLVAELDRIVAAAEHRRYHSPSANR